MPCPPEPPPGAAIARQVQARGIRDRRVLRAIGLFDRERFVPPEQRPRAGHDSALPIGFEQTISQPYIVAAMTEALELVGRERILEVGTGSGYQTAILAALAGEVFTIERLPTLSLRARGLLDGLGIANVRYRIGDGSLGWPEEAPFDRILIAAGSPDVPPALFDQLAEGGRLVAPVGPEEEQSLVVVEKRQGRPVERTLMPCRFVKLIGEGGWPEE
jgi:protein-L-isoaspartate(D-aspartate) O-methyltransferase